MRDATPAEWADWGNLVAAAPGGHNFWQLPEFAAMKAPAWRARPMVHDVDGVEIPALYLVRKLPFFGQLWYAPMGPRVATEAQLASICDDLRRECPAFAITLEPAVPVESADAKADVCSRIPGLVPSGDVQLGSHTVVVDLTQSEDELLASFKQRTRRSIRKADREGAVVEFFTDASAADDFWELHTAMAERAGITLRERAYFDHNWGTWLEAGKGMFCLARPSADAPYAAGAFVWYDEHAAVYKDGGSLRIPEANGLQYTVQWECMKWAKAHGCKAYDMFGMPPSWDLDDEDHRMHGLVQFKTGFGPVVDELGAVQLLRAPRMNTAWEKVGRRAYNAAARVRPMAFY